MFGNFSKKKEEKWGRLNILIPQTESFILGKIIRLKALSYQRQAILKAK